MASNKTVIVTGASQGIGAAVVQAFLGRGYNVVANFALAAFPRQALPPRRTSPSSMETSVKPRPLRTSHRPRSASSVQLISLVNNAGAFLSSSPSWTTQPEDFRSAGLYQPGRLLLYHPTGR